MQETISYTRDFLELKSLFVPVSGEISIPGSAIKIINERFISEIDTKEFLKRDDFTISENLNFTYPVFVPENLESRKVILFLHGLNERSWIKYLVWAYWLCMITGSYVVLFPISFHINRSPSSWIDPRMLQQPLKERNSICCENEMSTFANFALSNRLTEEPMRFFNSGYQTAFDIVKLMHQIKNGSHGLIPRGSQVNMFAYSIGAFLAQILMMGNPDNLFSGIRLFMFCGGSVFSNMKGTSRFIMDSMAYNRIYGYYLNDFEKEIEHKSPFSLFLRSTQIGMAFRSMIDHSRFRSFRENILFRLKDQIRSVSLKKDKVIPAEGIIKTMENSSGKNKIPVDVWDFQYQYSHENPFPVLIDKQGEEVDRCFERMISMAGAFLL